MENTTSFQAFLSGKSTYLGCPKQRKTSFIWLLMRVFGLNGEQIQRLDQFCSFRLPFAAFFFNFRLKTDMLLLGPSKIVHI